MHNSAFQYLKERKEINYDAEYRLFEIKPEGLEDFLLNKDFLVKDVNGNPIYAKDIAGFNITIPHKVRAREILLPEGYGLTKIITVRQDYYVFSSGAINTVKRDNEYYNTDAGGFIRSLEEDLKFDTKNKNIFVFGCGGAGRAVIAALTWRDTNISKIYIYDTDKKAAESAEEHFYRLDFLKDKLEFILAEQIPEKIKGSDLLVNASPVGMEEGDGSVIDKALLHRNLSVYDVVYNRETQLIKDAKSLGLAVVDGLGMLLYQGIEAFELWTEKPAPVDIMRRALNEAVGKLAHSS
jgi:shikimate dehydrogenase